MNGIDITRKIRALFDADTIIIIVSAYDLSEVEDEAKAAGTNMFMPKPLFQSTVCNVLMTLTADQDDYDFMGRRILLAEDNALNREIAVELLEMVHFTVECAENSQEAVDRFEAAAPGYYDAILMDIQMPILDGYKAAEKIRRLSIPMLHKSPFSP
ncbi:MAG: response regulator [Christensenella sp.]|uniref:response regulator n=1 Tax=Christensenella sp. TaxID=1935934 RepID=UPI002B1FBC51|nr:response regulator [Christensenella sp.]MEA5002492.1 response regulator [Christensenella sp.]